MANGQQLTEQCGCSLLYRYGIACRHHLLRAFLDNTPLPKTLLHPRWWLNDSTIAPTNWAPFYPVQGVQQPPQPGQQRHQATAIELSQIRAQLNTEERYRFDSQMEQVYRNMVNIRYQRLALQALPIGQPTPNPRSNYVRRTLHGRANERGLTANEVIDRQERRQAQAVRRAPTVVKTVPRLDIRPGTVQHTNPIFPRSEIPNRVPSPTRNTELEEVDRVPESPMRQTIRSPVPTTPKPPSLALAIRTPERPRHRRNPTPDTPVALPPSTAPPGLGGEDAGGRGKRKKQPTAKVMAERELANQRRRG
jgi:hypothetical protein